MAENIYIKYIIDPLMVLLEAEFKDIPIRHEHSGSKSMVIESVDNDEDVQVSDGEDRIYRLKISMQYKYRISTSKVGKNIHNYLSEIGERIKDVIIDNRNLIVDDVYNWDEAKVESIKINMKGTPLVECIFSCKREDESL